MINPQGGEAKPGDVRIALDRVSRLAANSKELAGKIVQRFTSVLRPATTAPGGLGAAKALLAGPPLGSELQAVCEILEEVNSGLEDVLSRCEL